MEAFTNNWLKFPAESIVRLRRTLNNHCLRRYGNRTSRFSAIQLVDQDKGVLQMDIANQSKMRAKWPYLWLSACSPYKKELFFLSNFILVHVDS